MRALPEWTSVSTAVNEYGPLAQLVEQLTLNQLVVGSIPTRPTNFAMRFSFFLALFGV